MLVEVCFELVCCVIEKGISVLSDHVTEIVLIQLGLLLSDVHKTQKLITDLIDTPVYDAVLNFSDATEHIIHKSGMHADYLKRCISQTGIVLSNPSSKIKNIILALELRILSQIFIGEPVEVVRKTTKTRIRELITKPEIIYMYEELATSGRDFKETEMINAYNLYELCKSLIGSRLLDKKFFDSLPIQIHDPRIRHRTFGERCVRNTARGIVGLIAFPIGFVSGFIMSVNTVALLPIAGAGRMIDEIVESKGDFKKIKPEMKKWFTGNISGKLLGPITATAIITEGLSDSQNDPGYTFGSQFFEKYRNRIKPA